MGQFHNNKVQAKVTLSIFSFFKVTEPTALRLQQPAPFTVQRAQQDLPVSVCSSRWTMRS